MTQEIYNDNPKGDLIWKQKYFNLEGSTYDIQD